MTKALSEQPNNALTPETKKKTSVGRLIRNIIGYVIIFLILAALAFVLISKAVKKTAFVFGKSIAWVMTDSMEPTIPQQSYILINKINAKDVKVGDVIMFVSDDPDLAGNNNTHRVVEIIGENEEFVTKGDAAQINDKYTVKADKVLAVYEKNLPFLSNIGRIMFSGIGIMISVTVILFMTMLLYIPDIMKATKKKTVELEDIKQKQINELIRKEIERLKAGEAAKEQAPEKTDTAEDQGEKSND